MPAVLPNIYTNINIAENDTVIVTGGTQNGTTLSKVLSRDWNRAWEYESKFSHGPNVIKGVGTQGCSASVRFIQSTNNNQRIGRVTIVTQISLFNRNIGNKWPQMTLSHLKWPKMTDITVYRGQLFVLGGYTNEGFPRNQNYGLINGREWHSLPNMIYSRYSSWLSVIFVTQKCQVL